MILFILPILLTGCFKDEKKANTLNSNKHNDIENQVKVPPYVDDNPVELSLYIDASSGGMLKSEKEYHVPWVMKKDIVVFGALFCTDNVMANDYFQNLWSGCAEKYADTPVKVGWHLRFSLASGKVIDQMIYKPSDVASFYDYLEIYLYDSANAPINTWYSHLLDEQMTDNTIITSMKLTAGSKYNEINSPIEVMAFTYDTPDDFTENGQYRGKSSYKVIVYND